MNKLKEITKILQEHAKDKTNLSSEDSRKVIAIEILESLNDNE